MAAGYRVEGKVDEGVKRDDQSSSADPDSDQHRQRHYLMPDSRNLASALPIQKSSPFFNQSTLALHDAKCLTPKSTVILHLRNF
jgi:hypothetical protein